MDPSEVSRTRQELLGFELALAARDGSDIAGDLADLIADDFIEFGASGRTWNAVAVRELLAGPNHARPTIEGFEIDALADGVVLATYWITAPVASIRSSVWVRRSGAWQIRFHQGTRGPAVGGGPGSRLADYTGEQ
jgi:hypothetical protein